MPIARVFFETAYPLSALSPNILRRPSTPYAVSLLVDVSTETEARDLVRAIHLDATDIEVRWAPEESLPRGSLKIPEGTCPSCGSSYQGLGREKLLDGGYRWEGGWVDTRACVCEGPRARVFGVRTRVPLEGWWVRLRHRTYVELAQVIARTYRTVKVRTREGKEVELKASGASRGKRPFPHVPPEDLQRVPSRVPVK